MYQLPKISVVLEFFKLYLVQVINLFFILKCYSYPHPLLVTTAEHGMTYFLSDFIFIFSHFRYPPSILMSRCSSLSHRRCTFRTLCHLRLTSCHWPWEIMTKYQDSLRSLSKTLRTSRSSAHQTSDTRSDQDFLQHSYCSLRLKKKRQVTVFLWYKY